MTSVGAGVMEIRIHMAAALPDPAVIAGHGVGLPSPRLFDDLKWRALGVQLRGHARPQRRVRRDVTRAR